MDDRDQAPPKKVNWPAVAGFVLAILGWASPVVRSYFDDNGDLKQRITRIEARQDENDRQFQLLRQDIGEIRSDIKKLLERR